MRRKQTINTNLQLGILAAALLTNSITFAQMGGGPKPADPPYEERPPAASEVVHLMQCRDSARLQQELARFENPALKVMKGDSGSIMVLVPSIWRNALALDSCDCETKQSFPLFFLADEPTRHSASSSTPGAGGTRSMSPFIRMLMEEVAESHYASLIPMESAGILLLPEVDTPMPDEFQKAEITF